MTHHTEERLRAADPARGLRVDDEAADRLQRSIQVVPRSTGPGPAPTYLRRLVSASVAAGAVAVAATVALAAIPGTSDRAVPVVDRAYAAVAPGGAILHELITSRWRTEGGDGPRGQERREGWYWPSTGQARRTYGGDEGAVEVVVGRDGRALVRSDDPAFAGRWRVDETPAFVAKNRTDFFAEFRSAYDDGRLSDRGRAGFGGQPARRLDEAPSKGDPRREWYVDPVSGHPLGAIERLVYRAGRGRPPAIQINEHRVERFERLDPSPRHLAQLSAGAPGR